MAETILVCEDDPLQRKLICAMLVKTGYRVIDVKEGREVITRIEDSNVMDIDAVLLDVNAVLQGVNIQKIEGFTVLSQIRKYRKEMPVVMMAIREEKELAIKAVKDGANDYVIKPLDAARLEDVLTDLVPKYTTFRELMNPKRVKEGVMRFDDLIGNKEGLAKVVKYGRKAAVSDIPVLITGETGTGKELLARAIHFESKRADASFVTINCSVIPEQTIEKVLIGHEKGSFVGATAQHVGEYREAKRGTLFLDDIHVLTPHAQVKLLRFLQDRTVEITESNKLMKVNVRVISSTHLDLKEEVKAGRFREDLYFRVNVLTIVMPPLRERKQDIIPLAEFFINKLCTADELPPKSLSDDAKDFLINYKWPGNVRELEGLIHRALVLCENDQIDRDLLLQIHD